MKAISSVFLWVKATGTKNKIENFMPIIDDAIEEGLSTLEKVEIRIHRAGKKDEAGE